MSTRCSTCCKLIRSICVTLGDGTLDITIPPVSFRNKERRCLSVCIPFPEIPPGTNPQLRLIDGSEILACYTKIGNLARASNIGCDRLWGIVFGDDPNHITICDGLIDLENCRCSGDGYSVTPVSE